MIESSGTGPLTHGFLFADLRGYTAFAERHGDTAAGDLLDRYRAMVRDVVGRTGGAEIKTEGDSFYVVFPSASRAVAAGLEIIVAANEASAADPSHPIEVGVGINAGEAEERPDGYVGSAVNLAARVCSVARPGEVLVTDMVRGLTRTSGRYRFTARGRPTLKGIAEPVALYRADPAGSTEIARRPPTAPRLRIAAGGGLVIAAVLVLVGASIVASGGSPESSAPGSSSAAGARASTGVDTSSGRASSLSSSPMPLPFGGRMVPGTHCSTTFTPAVCLTLPKGWSAITELPTELLISDEPSVLDQYQGVVGGGGGRMPELGAQWRSITISRPSFSVVPCSSYRPVGPEPLFEPVTAAIGRTRQEFLDQLRQRPELKLSETVPSELGASEAFITDVALAKSCGKVPIVYLDWWAPCSCPDGRPDYRGFAVVAGATSRLFVLDHQDRTISIAVTAPTAEFPTYVQDAKAVLSSLTFGP